MDVPSCNGSSEMSMQHPFPAISSKGGLPSLDEYENFTEPSVMWVNDFKVLVHSKPVCVYENLVS